MQSKVRETGYYWVKLGGEFFSDHWEIGEYRDWSVDRPWYLTDHVDGLSEEAIIEVSDRVLPPNKQPTPTTTTQPDRFGPQSFTAHYWFTEDGVPDGGILNGPGFTISMQRGTVDTAESGELAPNGVFSQTLIALGIHVLQNLYQKSKFANKYNEEAIAHLQAGQDALRRRLLDRDERGVLNTHEP